MAAADLEPSPKANLAAKQAGQRAALRETLLIAAYGREPPSEDLYRRLTAWSRAAAPNTLRAIASDLKIVDAYQAAHGRPVLPIRAMDLHALIDQRARQGARKSSIDRMVASLVRLHQLLDLPSCVDESLRWKQREVRKRDTRMVQQARGLRLKGEVDNMHADITEPVSLIGLLAAIPADPAGLRDRALISIGYDGGLRRSELVRIQVHHIEQLPSNEASLFLPRSKTDQEGEGARAFLSARSMHHLGAWLALAQLDEGYVFRSLSYRVGAAGHLSEAAVGRILKDRLRPYLTSLVTAGSLAARDVEPIVAATSAHSLRVGIDQDMFAAGVDIGAIMQGLRWSNPKQPLAYARHLAPGSSKLAAMLRSFA